MKYEDLDEMLLEIEECRKSKDAREYLLKEYSIREDFENTDLL